MRSSATLGISNNVSTGLLNSDHSNILDEQKKVLSISALTSPTKNGLSLIPKVIPFAKEDSSAAILCLATTFLDDPVLGRFLLRQGQYTPAAASTFFSYMFYTLYSNRLENCHIIRGSSGTGVDAVALWQAPDTPQGLPLSAMLKMFAIAPTCFGWLGILRSLIIGIKLDDVHPKKRHYFLGFLAVTPSMQGRGLGSMLIEPVLKKADAEGCGCYLEASSERNVVFYKRHGFEVMKEIQLYGKNSPKMWVMWREPRPQGSY